MSNLDIVDTSAQAEVILAIDARRLRRGAALDDRFARVVRDLVLGVPVAGSDLDEWGISALGVATAEELDEQADLFEYHAH